MHDDRRTPGASSTDVIDLVARLERRERARKKANAKHGKRTVFARMSPAEWRREFDFGHFIGLLVRQSNNQQHDPAIDFQSSGCSLNLRELRTMIALAHYRRQAADPLGVAGVGRLIGLHKGRASEVVRILADAGLIVNLGTTSRPNLAPNPRVGFWRLRALPDLRKGFRSPVDSPYNGDIADAE